jgi:hypothetical protein
MFSPIHTVESKERWEAGLVEELERIRIINEKKQIAKQKKLTYSKEYQKNNKKKISEWSMKSYYKNDESRQHKRLNQAYKRYKLGVNVSNGLVQELIDAGYGNGDIVMLRPVFSKESEIIQFD